MSTWGLDEEARADVVGTASARLLAAGVARDDRLGALGLLGVLSGSADEQGVVRRGFRDLCAEFELDDADAGRWLEALVGVGIVRQRSGGLVLAGVEPPATGGLRLADFLANAEVAAEPVAAEPVAVARRRTPVGAVHGLAAAAAVFVALVAVPLLGGGPAETGSVRATDDGATTADEDAGDAGAAGRSQWRWGGWGSAADGRSVSSARAEPAPTTSTTLVEECPVGEPLLEVIGIADGSAAGLPSVEGLVRNPTNVEVHVDGFTVVVTAGDHEVEVRGPDEPLTVGPGEAVRWTLHAAVLGAPEVTTTVVLDLWRWADEAAQQACR